MDKLMEITNHCNKLKWEAVRLKKELDRSIIQQDLHQLLAKVSDYKIVSPDFYQFELYDVRIVEYEYILALEITDKRGLFPYRWMFRLEYRNFNCRIYDHFLYQNRVHAVQNLNTVDDENLLCSIENIIKEYDQTISHFSRHKDPDTYTYSYEFEDEKKSCSCSTIFEVFETISANIIYPL